MHDPSCYDLISWNSTSLYCFRNVCLNSKRKLLNVHLFTKIHSAQETVHEASLCMRGMRAEINRGRIKLLASWNNAFNQPMVLNINGSIKGWTRVHYASSAFLFIAFSKFCLPSFALGILQSFLRLTTDQYLEKETGSMQHYSLMIYCCKYFDFDAI